MGTRHLAKWLGIMYTVASLCACGTVCMYVRLFVCMSMASIITCHTLLLLIGVAKQRINSLA